MPEQQNKFGSLGGDQTYILLLVVFIWKEYYKIK